MAGTGLRAIMTDFAIPDNPAELLSEQAGHWQVHEEASTTPWSLEQHAQRIANDAVAALCDDGAFSVAFSAINNFASLDSEAQAATVTLVVGIPMREGARRAACDLSAGMVGTVLRACKHVVQIGAADEAVARCRAALKAAVYLLSWLVQVAEKAHADKAAGAVANPTGKGKKRAGKAEAEIAFDWEAHREEAALRLQEVLDVSSRSRSPSLVSSCSSRPAVHPRP